MLAVALSSAPAESETVQSSINERSARASVIISAILKRVFWKLARDWPKACRSRMYSTVQLRVPSMAPSEPIASVSRSRGNSSISTEKPSFSVPSTESPSTRTLSKNSSEVSAEWRPIFSRLRPRTNPSALSSTINRLGYAESDPTADVEGHDAAAKAAIIASLAFGGQVTLSDVHVEGITKITPEDIDFAHRLNHCIKLLAITEKQKIDGEDALCVRVHPSMVPLTHPLATVRESFNAIFVEGDAMGELMFYGRGAGGAPTASAVLGDLIDASCNLKRSNSASIGEFKPMKISPITDLESQYFLEVEVDDQPGVLAQVATVFGEHHVSIRSMEQECLDSEARLIFITHKAFESDFQAAIEALNELETVRSVGTVLRVIGID